MTVGAQQALYLIGQLLGGQGRRIAVEACYPDVRAIFAMTGASLLPQPVDAEGIRLTAIGVDPASAPDVWW